VVDRIEEVTGIAEVADEWEALAESVGASPFARPGWFAAWESAFERAGTARVLCSRRGRRLTGAIPFIRGRGRLGSPTNWHTPVFTATASDDRALGTLAEALLGSAPSVLDMAFLDAGDPLLERLRSAAARRGRLLIDRTVLRSPFIRLDGDFESFEASLDAKFRRESRRRRRKLEGEGKLSVHFEDGSARLERLLEEGFVVEGSGWKTARGTAIAQSAATTRFYREVAHWAADRGALQLGFVRLDGRALAFSYSIVSAGVVHVVKVGFDQAFARYAPGTILTREAIARAYERGQRRYDFLGDDDRYKLDWTDAIDERVRLQAFGRTARGLAGFAAWGYGRPAARKAVAVARDGNRRQR